MIRFQLGLISGVLCLVLLLAFTTRQPLLKSNTTGLDVLSWTDVTEIDSTIVLDIRYATTNNTTHFKIYECPACFLRPEMAAALVKANAEFRKKGYRIKVFDCYRPKPAQQELWNAIRNPMYVARPSVGSDHNRGTAVDLTLVDDKLQEVDMGTPFDFFGAQAHIDYKDLPTPVLQNRKYLRETLQQYGFKPLSSEWWHFSFKAKEYPIDSVVWNCH